MQVAQGLKQNPIRVINDNNHPENLAYCSCGMPDHWYVALRATHSNDTSQLKILHNKLLHAALSMKDRNNWRMPTGKDMLRRLVQLAIMEMLDAKRFRQNDAWRVRVAFMGVCDSNWYRTWQPRYELVYSELLSWNNRAYRWMKVSPERIAKSKVVERRREREEYLNAYGREDEL